TVEIAALAIGGSYLAEVLGGSMTWQEYWNACQAGIRVGDLVPAILKTVVFGYLIGVISCYFGLEAEGGTEGVGRAATRSVVGSTFSIVIANLFLVRLIQILN